MRTLKFQSHRYLNRCWAWCGVLPNLVFPLQAIASASVPPPIICVTTNDGKCVMQGDGSIGGDGGAGGSSISETRGPSSIEVDTPPAISSSQKNPPPNPSLETQINYTYRKQEANSKPQPLTNDSVLQSGDGYKIVFTPAQATWVYIYQTDSSGKMFQLFPQKEMFGVVMNQTNPVAAGETRTVPVANAWFRLDKQSGTETIYFITTSQQDKELEMGYKNYEQAQKLGANKSLVATAEFKRSVEGRGPASIAFDESPVTEPYTVTTETGENFVLDTGYFTGRCSDVGGCANVLKFQHR